jgi:hypothetical protein
LTTAIAYKCFVTYIVSPLLFWIQLYECKELDKELSGKLNAFYSQPENSKRSMLKTVTENCYYAAQFSVDNFWYRAKVISFDKKNNLATVFFIDYGNTESLSIDRLRHLNGQFCHIKRLAVPLSLANIAPVSEDKVWQEAEIKEFKKLALNRPGEIYVKSNENWPIYFCKLTVKRKNPKNPRSTALTKIEVEEFLTKSLESCGNLYKLVKQETITSEYKDLFNQEVIGQKIYNLESLISNMFPNTTKGSDLKSHVAGSVLSESLISNSPEQHLKKMHDKCGSIYLPTSVFAPDELAKNLIDLDDDEYFNFQ